MCANQSPIYSLAAVHPHTFHDNIQMSFFPFKSFHLGSLQLSFTLDHLSTCSLSQTTSFDARRHATRLCPPSVSDMANSRITNGYPDPCGRKDGASHQISHNATQMPTISTFYVQRDTSSSLETGNTPSAEMRSFGRSATFNRFMALTPIARLHSQYPAGVGRS